MASEQPKRRGRPATGKRGTFTFRVTERLRDQLTIAATKAERPVSEEIELRLQQSFSDVTSGDEGTALLLRAIGNAVLLVERRCSNRPWTESGSVALLCREAVLAVVNAVLPAGNLVGARAAQEARAIGEATSLKELVELAGAYASSPRENKLLNAMKPIKEK